MAMRSVRDGCVWLLAGALALSACKQDSKSDTPESNGRGAVSGSDKGEDVESIIRTQRDGGPRDADADVDRVDMMDASPAPPSGEPDDAPDDPNGPSAGGAGGAGGHDAAPPIVPEDSGAPPNPLELAIPADPGALGPWPVGVRTVMVEIGTRQSMPVEVWYPAQPGSELGKDKVVYDLGQWLPPEAIAALPSGALPVPAPCNCYRDLPPDLEHGPYPASILVHNIGAFRVASAGILAHWASRGFIALAADHPDGTIGDWCATYASPRGRCTGSGISGDTQHVRDVPKMLAALRAANNGLDFLAGAIDASKLAVSGHSEGGPYAAATSGEAGVRLIMVWNATTTVTKRGDVAGVLYLASKEDGTIGAGPSAIEDRFWSVADSITPAFFANVNQAGHLSVTSFCNSKNAAGQTGMDLGSAYTLCGIDFTPLRLIWDCNASYLPQPQADMVFGYATTAALEDVLKGRDSSEAWTRFKSEWGQARQVR